MATRGALKLKWIVKDLQRKRTLKKRLASLIKMVFELTVLCDVKAFLVSHVPGEEQPVVWPSPEEAPALVEKYKELSALGKVKEIDILTIWTKQVEKHKVKVFNGSRANGERELKAILRRKLNDLFVGRPRSAEDLTPGVRSELGRLMEGILKDVGKRIEEKRSAAPPAIADVPEEVVQAPPAAAPLTMVAPPLMLEPPPTAVPVVEPQQPHDLEAPPPMTLDGQPRHGSFLFEMFDAMDVAGDGGGLPTPEELREVFARAGLLAPQPPPSDA
ncbi:agamous-like MADS-box protein AGL80 [Brachypodium distachyon]|uniref:MADS-box domain-containing protein n=1 Tax=Brachypodium distachyon TaxID=15368 RepID=A0A0Q3G8C3_BRADI|nr:agamous-like MADS-box protein AGL80 [Brachypodium distachyon]KQK07648.1 hypothetical protein BRADI_2g36782v3 [Brachypodium distachyon]|eukprot:XP_010233356.1 agamous-like MADS-box protein AGL80 [Brachypodium distachyon]